MNTMKTLMLAGFTALSLGAGSAMAQESGSFFPSDTLVTAQNLSPSSLQAPAARAATQGADHVVQSGSSDRAGAIDSGMTAFDQYNPYAGGN